MTPCSTQTPSLSIIVPAYNEARRLPPFMHRIVTYLDQRRLSYEILVVDDGSRTTRHRPLNSWYNTRSVCDSFN